MCEGYEGLDIFFLFSRVFVRLSNATFDQRNRSVVVCFFYIEINMSFSSSTSNFSRKQSSLINELRSSRASIDALLAKPLTFQETIGFSTLPDQIHRKTLKRGFEFTLMVVGKTFPSFISL